MIKTQSEADIDSPRPVNLSVAHQTDKTDVSVYSKVDKANALVQPTVTRQMPWCSRCVRPTTPTPQCSRSG